MNDRPEWFAPKSHGYGSGLPIAWQGWALLLGFLALTVGGALFLAPKSPPAFLALLLPLTAIFMWIAARTTRGGWRWRWGSDERSE